MPSFTKKQQMGILIVGIILMFATSYFKKNLSQEDYYDDFEKIPTEEVSEGSDMVDNNNEDTERLDETLDITVYIKGAISKPGIVTTETGKRVIDIVERAGGFVESADVESVNLARKVQDEEMIHIPHIGEQVESQVDSSVSSSPQDSANPSGELSSLGPESKININTASQEELKSLSGIGDATAEKIIQHRESSPFSKIEDIMDVSGIGEKKFEAIQDSIAVN